MQHEQVSVPADDAGGSSTNGQLQELVIRRVAAGSDVLRNFQERRFSDQPF